MLFVVAHQLASLGSNLVKNVVYKRVHDRHRPLADACVRVHLFEHAIYIHRVGFCLGLDADFGGRFFAVGVVGCLVVVFGSFVRSLKDF